MNKRFAFYSIFLFLILESALSSNDLEDRKAASFAAGKTLVLYDAVSGVIPGKPLMTFTDFPPGAASLVYTEDATLLDTTTLSPKTYAGWTSTGASTPGFPLLDRLVGFQVDFTLQIEYESHGSNHRSGFSLIVLSEDTKGIELAFWEDEIWAQSDRSTGGLFHHGEGVHVPTTGLTDYRLNVVGDTYTLFANTEAILTGPLRDYSEFDGFPDPYQTPNFLFLGDNTTSAQARVRLRFLSVTGTEPVIPTGTSASSITMTGTRPSNPKTTIPPTPLPSLTPVPSPAPASKDLEFCPPAGLVLVMASAKAMTPKYRRASSRKIF